MWTGIFFLTPRSLPLKNWTFNTGEKMVTYLHFKYIIQYRFNKHHWKQDLLYKNKNPFKNTYQHLSKSCSEHIQIFQIPMRQQTHNSLLLRSLNSKVMLINGFFVLLGYQSHLNDSWIQSDDRKNASLNILKDFNEGMASYVQAIIHWPFKDTED